MAARQETAAGARRLIALDALRCAAICTCAGENLAAEGLWADVMAKRLTPALKTRLDETGRACAAVPR